MTSWHEVHSRHSFILIAPKEEQAKAKYQELVWQRGYITAELLKRELMEEDKPKGFLMEEARLFIEEKRPCVGITVAKPTFANYIYATQLIEAYLREREAYHL